MLQTFNPLILEKSSQYLSPIDVFSKLAQNRILFINGDITEDLAGCIIAQMLYLDSINNKDIMVYINSCGGLVDDGLAIYDTAHLLKSTVNTTVIGKACSMGALLTLMGKKRFILKLSRVMFHQPMTGTFGNASEIRITNEEIDKMKNSMYKIIKEKTLITNPEELFIYDKWFNAEEALEKGVVTNIL